jgi:hypothetical protein
LGSIKAENVQAPEGEEKNCSWTVTPLTEGASDIAEIFLIDDYSDVYGTALFVRLGSQRARSPTAWTTPGWTACTRAAKR